MSCQDSSLQVLNTILLASLRQSISYLKILQNVIILIIFNPTGYMANYYWYYTFILLYGVDFVWLVLGF